jgi:hypothetical protein
MTYTARPSSVRPVTERLEPRRLFATVVAQELVGSELAVTSVVLTFDGPLNPVTAQNVDAYSLTRAVRQKQESFFDFLPDGTDTDVRRVRLQSAVYDDAARTVRLTPVSPFDVRETLRRIRVRGRGALAVTDAAGVPLDGNGDGTPGGDAVVQYRYARAEALSYRDADGDRVRLRLRGPGQIVSLRDTRRPSSGPILFLRDTNGLRSVLRGSVVRHRTGDGVATIRQLTGASFAAIEIANNPAFRVEITNP